MHALTAALVVATVVVLATPVAMAIEEPRFKLVEQGGSFELRDYEPYVVAETRVDAGFDDAGGGRGDRNDGSGVRHHPERQLAIRTNGLPMCLPFSNAQSASGARSSPSYTHSSRCIRPSPRQRTMSVTNSSYLSSESMNG